MPKTCYTVSNTSRVSESTVINARTLFELHVTGSMNIKQVMHVDCAIVMLYFIVEYVMKGINVMIVEKSFVHPASRYRVANCVHVNCSINMIRHVR